MGMAKLILLRHGQSVYNRDNLFTGWTDVALSEQGVQEAKAVGRLLKEQELYPEICFTSWLERAIRTAQLALRELEWEHIDCLKSWKLNERHYGTWQGRHKEEVEKEIGYDVFSAVRRGYATPPPPLPDGDPRLPECDKKFEAIDAALLPRSESLADTRLRTVQYYFEWIVPELSRGKTVLVSAHGNSLRALVMQIEQLEADEISDVEIPTGEPLVYIFDETMNMLQSSRKSTEKE